MKNRDRNKAGKREGNCTPWLAYGKATAIGMAAVLLMLAVFAGMIAGGLIPEKGMEACVLASSGVGGAAAACSAFCMSRKGSGLGGMLSGFLLALCCSVCGFLLYRDIDILWCAVIALVTICTGGISGWAAAGKKKRRR